MRASFPRRATIAVLTLVAVFLGACATPPVRPVFTTAAERSLSGRMSIHYHDLSSDRDETLHGNFDWAQHGTSIDFSVLDPFGQSVALVHSEPGRATLTLNNGRTIEGDSPEALTQSALGFTLPVSGLSAWLEGRMAEPPTGEHSELLADGTRQFTENGWTIHYPESKTSNPLRRIDLTYPGPGVSVDLRLVVDHRDPLPIDLGGGTS